MAGTERKRGKNYMTYICIYNIYKKYIHIFIISCNSLVRWVLIFL